MKAFLNIEGHYIDPLAVVAIASETLETCSLGFEGGGNVYLTEHSADQAFEEIQNALLELATEGMFE